MSQHQTRDDLRNSHSHKLVTEHEAFSYSYSPEDTAADTRYVFNDGKVAHGIQEAIEYVLDLEAASAGK